ncbi:hypothetical protein AWZ03_005922 [Drosophila navojoa]|uniref:Uncharacterized protein n=1 Tax=Drosophila navojoa TaxID=7232 RepID=A0A484BG16_DRONA|nr:hypothetical protein AWZ03_005922 [Drosophila navojoa]
MAVPFHLPVEERDDIASSSSGTSNSSSASTSSGASSSSGASDGASSIASQSPNTTSSATQTPMQSPLPTDQVLIALCEWYQQHQRHYINSANATASLVNGAPLITAELAAISQFNCQFNEM